MMVNLFSTFEPSTSMNFSFNWMSIMLGLMLVPFLYWISFNRISMFFYKMLNQLHLESKLLLKNKPQGATLLITTMFMFILLNNLLGLLPYIFTSSSHLTFTLAMAMPMWFSIMLFGWINNHQEMLAHMVPNGTPNSLMPFMVIIETISNLIRPGSLAVRLTANMIAGHLLMSLLGSSMSNAPIMIMFLIYSVQIGLMIFESAVSIIQAYVFSILTTLYSSEVIYENT